MSDKGNLMYYNELKAVPENAKKPILGGRLKGKTDINPMWRIKVLTETFGACGSGWKYEIVEKRLEQGADGEVAAFVDINLYVTYGGEWSEAIPGTGGSAFIAKEKGGLYTSDECFKMALTDALSVACKALGVGADVYWDKDSTKYTSPAEEVVIETVEQAANFVIEFGKHKGEKLGNIWKSDYSYIEWMEGNDKTDAIIKKAIGILSKAAKK
jgi:hypothetical protein